MAFFFPNAQGKPHLNTSDRTIALIRPTAFEKSQAAIIEKIKKSGFQIAMTKTVHFNEEQAREFYAEHKEKPFFNELVKEMTKFENFVISSFCIFLKHNK